MGSPDPSDDLHDAALAEDIALLGDLMAAASKGESRDLTEAEVDEALGLPASDTAPAGPGPTDTAPSEVSRDAAQEPSSPREPRGHRKGRRPPRRGRRRRA